MRFNKANTKLYESLSSEHIEDFIEDIYDLRKDSLSKEGEYGIGNLIFKEMRALGYLDNLKELKDQLKGKELSLEKLDESIDLVEAKVDIQKFIDKFGEDTFNNFIKAKDRLKNKGYSTDILYYVKNTSKEDLQKLLVSLYEREQDAQKKRIVQGTDKEIRGHYNYLGEKDGNKVYQPLDAQASMDLGVNTGWCTTGRYEHYGHPEFAPSIKDAMKHWSGYTEKGIKFYYFLNPKTMYGEYAVAVYPESFDVQEKFGDILVEKTNVEVYNAEDSVDYAALTKLPIDLIPQKIIFKYKKLPEFEIEDGVLLKWNSNNSTCIIPNGVTSIGTYAFDGYNRLTSVTIPNSVTSIGNSAFSYCTSLKSIEIPDSVTSIGKFAFYYCTSLTSITMPNSVTSIEDGVFTNCSNLTNITIPNSVTSIKYSAFSYCKNLKSIIIPDGVKNIEDSAFSFCTNLTNIVIPNSVTSIGNSAFEGCTELKSIEIPDSVTTIEDYAFFMCVDLTVITQNQYVIDYCKANKIRYKSTN